MVAKILVVDDEIDIQDLITQRFEEEIEADQFQFIFADNGASALEKLQNHPNLDLVLTDINMPVMDGLTLLNRVKELYPLMKTIVFSAYGDMDNIRKAMNAGAFDFLTKPISFRDLDITLHRGIAQVEQLKDNYSNLQKAQLQLVQTEKMSALGQLVAGVAHEINNPVNFIYGNLKFAENYTQDLLDLVKLISQHGSALPADIQDSLDNLDFEFLQEDFLKLLRSMRVGVDRIRAIVLSLRNFSRVDKAEEQQADLHAGIDDTLVILQHRLKAQSHRSAIEVIKDYDNLPLVKCYLGQLNQVFMNILSNAIDAVEEMYVPEDPSSKTVTANSNTFQGEIRIQTRHQDGWITIRIADNAKGIPAEVCQKLFNPFFTTKPVGKGTGLGLSISYQIIVEKHQGRIWCNSVVGQGTEFVIEIPTQQSKQKKNHPEDETALTRESNLSKLVAC
jgi:signal transduction histidine kinase